MVFIVTTVFFFWTLYFVYQGGREVNDHVVSAFVFGCMIIYPFWAWLYELHHEASLLSLTIALSLGPILMWALFWILARRQDAGWRMPIAYSSQIAYAFALWSWGLAILVLPVCWMLDAPLWQPWLLILALGLSLWGSTWVYWRRYQVRIVPVGQLGIRVLQLSDLHVSPVMRAVDMNELIDKSLALKPDVIVITGDMVMPFSEDTHDFLLDALKPVPVPIICCLGNHDLPIENILVQELRDIGAHVLVDACLELEIKGHCIEWVGLQFQWRDAEGHYQQVMKQYPKKTCAQRVLLVHDPRYFKVVNPSDFGLMLSGHTHGGQFGLNMFGLPFSFFRPLGFIDQGIFRKGGLIAYVHKGNWHTGLPPRVGIAPEIAIFEL